MHLIFLGIAKNHVPSCLKILKLWGYHYEAGESDELFLKNVSFEMKQDCKRKKLLVLEFQFLDDHTIECLDLNCS